MTEKTLTKPKASSSFAQKELDKAEEQFESFENQVKEMTLDRMNTAPKEESEPQTKMSQKEMEKAAGIYLKPVRSIGSREKFNETYRSGWEYDKEYVSFIAEHKELIGDKIETWTKPYPGVPAEYWEIPSNKVVWGPRYVAEQIKRKFYHRLVMSDQVTGSTGVGTMYGTLIADTTVQRLDARPVNTTRKSIFMGNTNF